MFVIRLLPEELLSKAKRWTELKRWERREVGQELRRLGLSYREISAVIPVTKGTLSEWCRDMELTQDQQLRLSTRHPALAVRRRLGAERRMHARRLRAQTRSAGAREGASRLDDPTWVAGVIAYWSEGCKRKELRFTNSDPDMIRLFITWSAKFLDLTPDRYAISLHLHSGQDENERKEFWSHVTGIPPSSFRKTFVKREGTGHRKNLLYNGTAAITIRRSGDQLQRVLGWIDAIRRPLDGPVNFRRAASSTG